MKTLIVYNSNTGNTKAYAERIAKAIGVEAVPFKKRAFNKIDLDAYDTIVFGGWVQGSEIVGLNDFLSRWDEMEGKNVLVYSVGMNYVCKESREAMISSNLLDLYHLRYYMLRGSFDFKKLKFPQNMLLKIGVTTAIKRGEEGTDVEFLSSILENPFVYDDVEGTDRMIAVLNKLALEASK